MTRPAPDTRRADRVYMAQTLAFIALLAVFCYLFVTNLAYAPASEPLPERQYYDHRD